jgi:hypothetical protein
MSNIDVRQLLAIAISLGFGLSVTAILYCIFRTIINSFDAINRRKQLLEKRVRLKYLKFAQRQVNEDVFSKTRNAISISGSIVGILMVLLIDPGNIIALVWSATIGSIIGYLLSYIVIKSIQHKRLREIAYFYEAMFIYLNHYNLYDVVQLSGVLVPGIYPYIKKALLSWSVEGFKQLAVDLGNTDEAMMLSSVLIQLYQKGHTELKEVISRERQRLEEIRTTLSETENESKPMYQAVNLLLPCAGFFSLVVLPWVYYLQKLLGGLSVNADKFDKLQNIPFIKFF